MHKLVLICSLSLLQSCIGAAAYDEKLIGRFSLNAMDALEGMDICHLDDKYRVGIVPSTVYAVGFNEQFIIAKQHPEGSKLTFYYIIKVTDDIFFDEKNRVGPLNEQQFGFQKERLGVPESLKFTRVFKQLE